jgi:LysR family transcriptional regulator, nitrogen assimilation regulatory protein
MDLRELRSFIYIARLRSFSRAAAELHIAQPALSRQIRKLEEELGATLLERHPRGVELTEAGHIVLKRAELLVNNVRQIRDEVQSATRALSGQIAVAVPPAAGSIILPPLLRRFRQDYPNVSVHIQEGVSSTLHNWIQQGRVDVAIMHNPPAMQTIRIESLLHEAMYVVERSGAAGRSGYQVQDLAGLPLLLPAYPHFTRLLVEQVAAEHGFCPEVVMEVDGTALTGDLIAAGFGYGVATYAAIHRRLVRGELRATPFLGRKLYSTVAVGYRESGPTIPALPPFLARLRETTAELVGQGIWPGEVHLATARPPSG